MAAPWTEGDTERMTAGSLPPPVVEENQRTIKAPWHQVMPTLCGVNLQVNSVDYSTGDDMYPGHLNTEVNEPLGLERRRGTRVPELSPPSCGHSSSPCGPGR
ncbi:uncharacterized protein ACBT57_012613 isoform 1-T1 [Dama dama]